MIQSGILYTVAGMPVLVGDGTKKGKFGRKMPCVKRLHEQKENTSNHYIFGHMFGAIGVLAGGLTKLFCIPLSVLIHDGDCRIKQWENEEAKDESHVVRTIRDACHAVKQFTKSLLILDRYYLTKPALAALAEEEKQAGKALLSIVTRAKSNATAYEKPVQSPGRGRPRLKGDKVKILSLADRFRHEFIDAAVMLYGKEEHISYFCTDLLWGDGLYRELRFVIVLGISSEPAILVSTDLTLSPVDILRIYGLRFKIECAFRELKNTVAGFAYRFWSAAMPKLDRFAKPGTDALESVTDENDKRLIANAFNATQGYVMFASVALGLLQICALRFSDTIKAAPSRWLRTRSNIVPSEATTADFLRKSIFRRFGFPMDFPILGLIRSAQAMFPKACERDIFSNVENF